MQQTGSKDMAIPSFKSRLLSIFGLVLSWAFLSPLAADNTQTGAPDSLDHWQDWVAYHHHDLDCPVLFDTNQRGCQWLGQLAINASAAGATFNQSVETYTQSRFRLPGDSRLWPANVSINGDTAPVVADELGHPSVMLSAGKHDIVGNFKWSDSPKSLPVNPNTGLIALRWNGRLIENPKREQHRLALGIAASTTPEQQTQNKLDLTVVRRIQDGHPLTVETRIIIDVAGFQRDVVLGKPLLEGLIPLSINSGELPAQLNNDGGLRVQVRPGRWQISIVARSVVQTEQLTLEPQASPWPEEEAWAYTDSPQHRLTKIEGVPQIDPRQSKLPQAWQRWPAFLIMAGDTLSIDTQPNSDVALTPDQLQLKRAIWLDFDGQGYSLRDQLVGQLQNSWRLEMSQPLELQSAKINQQPQFITTINNGESSGVEVRQGNLNLQADLRFDSSSRRLPANGWDIDFQSVAAVLNTPPGWQVLTVQGADNIPGAWLSRWTVYKVFLLLVTVLAIGKLWRWPWAIVALVAFVPLWLELSILAYVIIPMLICTALSRLLHEKGTVSHWVRFARIASLLILTLVIVPFMVQQARNSIFPQLDRYGHGYTQYDQRMQERAVDLQDSMSKGANSRYSNIVATEAAPNQATKRKVSTEIDPTLVAQTGEGLPDWQWKTTRLSWNGPVLHNQEIKLLLLSPAQVFLIRFAALALLAMLLWRFLDINSGKRGRWWLAPVALAAMSGNAHANFPPEQLLNELSERMRETEVAAPRASINAMRLQLDNRSLKVELDVHALSDTAVPLPFNAEKLLPLRVTRGDGLTDALLFTRDDGYLWAQVTKGVQTLNVEVFLENLDQFQMPMILPPHHVTIASDEWTVRGLDKNGVPSAQLNFVRTQVEQDDTTTIKPSVLPPFFKIDRELTLGIKWRLVTTVIRRDSNTAAQRINVPLVDGETVITDGIDVENNNAIALFGAGTQRVQWESVIEPVSPIQITAATLSNALEVWRLDAGTMWHVKFDGLSPIYHQSGGNSWQPNWHPWPGDSLSIDISRPNGVSGPTMGIKSSALEWRPGSRVTEGVLTLSIVSSQGKQHPITLPEGAELQSFLINGQAQATSTADNVVSLPLQPGTQSAEIRWRQAHPISNRWTTPSPNLNINHVNAKLSVQMPTDRWVIWLDGPRLGPAVVIWGLLIIMLFLAAALGEASRGRIPAGALTWLFVGLGLSQITILALIPIAIWLFLLHIRATTEATSMNPNLFNTLQFSIVVMTFIALTVLLQAVQTGLLGYPQMQIQGNGSSAHLFNWYQDRASPNYPQARIISVPLIFYRAIMLVWALWLAYTLIKWLQWGWHAFSDNNMWSSPPKKPKKAKKNKAQDITADNVS
jgi:hypothetical protein